MWVPTFEWLSYASLKGQRGAPGIPGIPGEDGDKVGDRIKQNIEMFAALVRVIPDQWGQLEHQESRELK